MSASGVEQVPCSHWTSGRWIPSCALGYPSLASAGTVRFQCSAPYAIRKKNTVTRSCACSNTQWMNFLSFTAPCSGFHTPKYCRLVYEWSKLQHAATALTLGNFSHRMPQNARTAFSYLTRYCTTTALYVPLVSLTWFSVFREDSEVLLNWVYCYCWKSWWVKEANGFFSWFRLARLGSRMQFHSNLQFWKM